MPLKGTGESTVDPKGRACIPAKYRSSLGDLSKLVVWWSGNRAESFLMLASESEYERVFRREYTRVAAEQRSKVMRTLQVNMEPIELDKSARFVLPERLATKAGIHREDKIFYIGFRTHLEIWNLNTWLAQEAAVEADTEEVQLNFAPEPEWLFDTPEPQPEPDAVPAAESGEADG